MSKKVCIEIFLEESAALKRKMLPAEAQFSLFPELVGANGFQQHLKQLISEYNSMREFWNLRAAILHK